MSRETGGYAFPIPNADFQTFQPSTVDEYKRIQSGMTLRDYFAAKAMQAMIAAHEPNGAIPGWAYGMADEMLKAREVE